MGGLDYIADWMSPECLGWYKSAGIGGIEPLDWMEIEAFSRSTQMHMEPWEAQQVRLISVAYVSGYARGMQPMTVSPAFLSKPDEDPGIALERKRISDQIKSGFSKPVQ